MDFVNFMQQSRRQWPSRSRRRQLPDLRLARRPDHRAGHQRPRQHKPARMPLIIIKALWHTAHITKFARLRHTSRLDGNAMTSKTSASTAQRFYKHVCACAWRHPAAAQKLRALLPPCASCLAALRNDRGAGLE